MEAYDAIPYNAAIMTRRGVVVSINSDDAEEATHLNQEAAKTMKYGGLSHDEALKLVTLNPAIQLGIDKRVGSIDVGKDADLVIYNHDPLSAYAVVQQTLIDGRVYFDRKRDIADRAALEKEKKALMEKEKKAGEKKPDATIEIGKKPGAKPDEKKTGRQAQAAANGRRFRRCSVKSIKMILRFITVAAAVCIVSLAFFRAIPTAICYRSNTRKNLHAGRRAHREWHAGHS